MLKSFQIVAQDTETNCANKANQTERDGRFDKFTEPSGTRSMTQLGLFGSKYPEEIMDYPVHNKPDHKNKLRSQSPCIKVRSVS